MPNINGYDKYLEYQSRLSGSFYKAVFDAIKQADPDNRDRMAKGFPEEVEAYLCFTRKGVKEFVKHIRPDHPLLIKFELEYGLNDPPG